MQPRSAGSSPDGGPRRSTTHAGPATPTPKVAVVVSRFPKFTETFVVNEIRALQALGWDVEIHPLLPVEAGPHQPAAARLVEQAHFGRPWGAAELRAVVRAVRTRPGRLARVVGRLFRDTWRTPLFGLKDLVLLPRTCAIAMHIERTGIDHVHAHFATHAGFAAWAVGRLVGVPYSIVAHGSDVHRHRSMLRTKVEEAAFVATVSEYNRSAIAQTCGVHAASKVELVRVGVDTRHITPRADVSLGDPPVVTCVGTLHEVKGQRFLVEALARLHGRGQVLRLRLVGSGEDGDLLRDLVRDRGVEAWVDFTGAIPHEEVLAELATTDVVVVPSVASRDRRKEGLPTVLMEAMASGVPVVASRLAGIPELVEDGVTGLLAEPGDAEDLARAIERMISDATLRANVRAAALDRVRSRHTIEASAAHMASLIRRAHDGGAITPAGGSSR